MQCICFLYLGLCRHYEGFVYDFIPHNMEDFDNFTGRKEEWLLFHGSIKMREPFLDAENVRTWLIHPQVTRIYSLCQFNVLKTQSSYLTSMHPNVLVL